MRRSRKLILYFSIVIIFGSGISFLIYSKNIIPSEQPSTYPLAEKIQLAGFSNLYKISDSVYRSEQPDRSGMLELKEYGIQAILNLRYFHSDNDEANGINLKLYRVPMQAGKITDKDILQSMVILKNAPKPLLVHCLHGSDRTGCMIASYRIIYQNWSKEDAIRELKNPDFGYHESWFPNIIETLKNMDVTKMRQELGVRKK